MKIKIKKLSFYIIMILVFGSLMYLIALKGSAQHPYGDGFDIHTKTQNPADGFFLFSHLILEHIQSSIGILLLQIIIILVTCRIVGKLFKKMGQPTVIGEIMAGIILGPSVLGFLFPQVSSFIFPEESLFNIKILSQFGLILFMYTIGMELDLSVVRKRFQDTILISHASTIVPFFLGMVVAYFIYDKYAHVETPFLSFALFIGIALSITAFPVLARIIQERGMTKTHLGAISLASAANGDITAWCLLAAVVAYAQAGTMNSAIFNVLFSFVYVAVMLYVVRPLLRIIGDLYHNKEIVGKSLVAFMFFILLVSSYVTEILGLHALFGAFVAGIVMPENLKFRKIMNEKVEDISLALFLPLFFVYTGLRTEIGLINGSDMWLLCGIFILAAVVGKFGGTMIAARISNESWKNSLYMGALMNTRGLMELVVLSIGLEMNIIPPAVFVMLVLMTLVTTFMTTPLISFINVCFRASERMKFNREERLKTDTFKVLLSFGRASSGQVMLDLAHQMFSKKPKRLEVTALHLTVGSDINPLRTEDFEKVSFAPILYEADKLNILIKTRYDVCDNAEQHICSIVNKEGFDFLLVGAGISMSDLSTDVVAHKTWKRVFRILKRKNSEQFLFYPGSLIKDKTKSFIEKSCCTVGIFANRGFIRAENVLVIFNAAKDLFLLDYAANLQKSTHGFVKLMNRVSPTSGDSETVTSALSDYLKKTSETAIPFEKNLTVDILKEADLMLVSYDTWLILSEECEDVLQDMPSTFIIQHKS
ncbi:MAG: cation:proton antiporter [Tannerella sp.]|jgi:Kef-type K+ transport system membrane component KefB|nr:cation:proton antiporter [Tannerella sp.]